MPSKFVPVLGADQVIVGQEASADVMARQTKKSVVAHCEGLIIGRGSGLGSLEQDAISAATRFTLMGFRRRRPEEAVFSCFFRRTIEIKRALKA